jgi:hypothetical protein
LRNDIIDYCYIGFYAYILGIKYARIPINMLLTIHKPRASIKPYFPGEYSKQISTINPAKDPPVKTHKTIIEVSNDLPL